jgi:hypothetical protein
LKNLIDTKLHCLGKRDERVGEYKCIQRNYEAPVQPCLLEIGNLCEANALFHLSLMVGK